jgi:hypothetical protein
MIRALALVLPLFLAQDEAPSFTKDQRLTAAYYYPAAESKAASELAEMGKAGVEIALVAFPGDPASLDPLIAALDALEKERQNRPRLGVFVQPGARADLSAVEAFYDRVPKRHWAQIEGRPVVWLAPAPAGAGADPAPLAAALGRLKRPPYLVSEISWKDAPADRTYAWGASRGYALELPVVSVGPGALGRDDGKVYERLWYKAIRLEPHLVAIESWNGAADGVSETPERKRKYLDLTHRFVRDFKVNEKFSLPKGKFTAEKHVAFTVVYNPHDQGLRPIPTEDGLYEELRAGAFQALTSRENKKGTVRRICFDVDDSFCYFDKRAFEVVVEFFDAGEGSFSLEYDSGDGTLPAEQRAVKSAGQVRFTNSGEWRLESFKLPDAVFGNGQPGGGDFRLTTDKRGLSIRMVMVLRR